MNFIKNIYSKWKHPEAFISIIFGFMLAFFTISSNFIYMKAMNDSFPDFYFYTIKSLIIILIETTVSYLFLKALFKTIRNINKDKDSIFKKLKLQFDNMPVGVVVLDADFYITNWNFAAENIFGYKKSEVVGKNAYDVIIPDDIIPLIKEVIEKIKNSAVTVLNINDNITKDQKRITCQWYSTPLFDENNNYIGMMGMAIDISEKLKYEEQNNKLLSAVEQSPFSIFTISLEGNIDYVNPKVCQVTNYGKEEIIGKSPEMFKSEYVTKETMDELVKTITSGRVWNGNFLNRKKTGELYWVNAKVAPIRNSKDEITHFVAIEEDITEKKLKDEQLKHALEEKELMLKEIHHRVKNNLQIISSLLSLQSQNIKDPEMQKLFNMSRDRVRSMSLIHQQLYKINDGTKINFDDYIKTLANQLLISYVGTTGRIKINSNINHISFGLDTAIPCGLIINELLVNSIKHGFNGSKSGEINVEIKNIKDGKFMLTVADNGIGLSSEFENKKESGMGMKIVKALTNQLDGKMNIFNGKGTRFEIEFEEANSEKSISLN
jgi:PAS domain S-box-containing protein